MPAQPLSARQLVALKHLIDAGHTTGTGEKRIVDLSVVEAVDQRPLGGLGRRGLLLRQSENRFLITSEAVEAVRLYDSIDVFRKAVLPHLASVFERTPHFKVARRITSSTKKKIA